MKPLLRIISIVGVIILLVIESSQLSAQDVEIEEPVKEILQKANEAYSSGRYDEAIADYKAITATFGFSAEVLYNLGNSYAQKGRSGLAILQYLRGLQLSPEDSDMKGNLDLVRKNIGMFDDIPTLKDRFFNMFNMNQWALLTLTAYGLITFLWAIAIRYPVKKGAKIGTSFLLIATIGVSCTGVYLQRNLWNGAVITAPNIRLLMSPFESASSLGAIQEGSLVFRKKNHGNYYYINDQKGRSGWVPTTSLESLIVSPDKYVTRNE